MQDQPKLNSGKLEITPNDFQVFDLRHKAEWKVEAAMLLFVQWGKKCAAQEAPVDDLDDNV